MPVPTVGGRGILFLGCASAIVCLAGRLAVHGLSSR